VHKGTNSAVDSYSAFFDNQKLGCTDLESILRRHGVTDAFVCGLALDLCVGSFDRTEFSLNISLRLD
jgi:nicotinamidase-related amidase